MRPIIPWRSRAAVWLLIPGLLGIVAYSAQFADETTVAGYWPAAMAGSAIYLVFSCGVAATAGAWEGRRFRAAAPVIESSSRSSAAVVADHLWTPLAAGLLLQVVAIALMSRDTWGAPGGPSPLVGLAFVGILFFHSCIGFALGRWLPPVASIPLSLLVSYSWLGFTWSVDYFPVRYLAGLVIADCCSVETSLDVRAPIIATAFSLLAGCSLLVIAVARRSSGDRAHRFGVQIGASSFAVVTLVALAAGSGLGAAPILGRPQAQATCSGAAPTICLFPEQRDTGNSESVIRKAVENLSRAGITVPPTIRASNAPATADVLNMIVQVRMTDSDLLHSITTSMLGDAEVAYCGTEEDDTERRNDAAVANRWLIDVAAESIVNADHVEPALELDNPDVLRALRRAPAPAQAAWVTATVDRLTDCSIGHIAVPSS
ncbi:DUF7224 domain-containing protein [Curtobacterium flaccumfaciens]|uniref:DUF7224 domain-containing protein n=1 Tax=Curtobacterium flaccumfaciens TaxID=2035 RepID=UPI001ADA5A7F|nr:hypothetical protein [Curtobacterium flaccumfaciens]MBO9040622.1 hypothetical protein [Curtobacterium flaccumfaciens pv. flaccumfaciens]